MIAPAILERDFEKFKEQVKRLEGIFDYVQIDVMDGAFVEGKSFADIEKINDLHTNLKFEVHLMVKHPLAEIEKWSEIKNVFRIILHVESEDDANECISFLHGKCLQAGIAINPETSLERMKDIYDKVDQILFMTVHPGKQGGQFISSVGDKIKEFTSWPNHPVIAVDGGINTNNIKEVKNWGVDTFNIGSALLGAQDIKEAYTELNNLIS